ncbi:MAG: hypothetical protein DCC58_00055 [Chloroflexi bacterium]|nr:MAG: hypothetical protein DCC58_00055 [Chloroflexota bacterium]
MNDADAGIQRVANDGEYDARGVRVAAFAHGAHDIYPSFIGPLVPQVQDKLGISLALASLMVPAQQLPSVFQPFIGYLADRTSRRWFVVLSPGVAAVSLSSIGLAPNIAVVLMLLFVSGLASATFHAPAVALVGEFGGNRMGRAMSIFMAGGEVSRTVGPLLITGAIALLTLEGSFVVMVVGLAASVILYLTLDTRAADARRLSAPKFDLRPLLRARRKPIAGILGFTIVTGIATMPFHYFLVKFLVEQGHSVWYGGIALSTLFASGIVGGLIGGTLSDRYGRQWVLGLSVGLAPPLLYLYLLLEDGSIAVLTLLFVTGISSPRASPPSGSASSPTPLGSPPSSTTSRSSGSSRCHSSRYSLVAAPQIACRTVNEQADLGQCWM